MHKNPQNPLKTKEKQFFQARIMFAFSVVILSQTPKVVSNVLCYYFTPGQLRIVRKMMLASRSPKRSTFSIGLAGGPGIVNWI